MSTSILFVGGYSCKIIGVINVGGENTHPKPPAPINLINLLPDPINFGDCTWKIPPNCATGCSDCPCFVASSIPPAFSTASFIILKCLFNSSSNVIILELKLLIC